MLTKVQRTARGLIELAKEGKTITYEGVAKKVGLATSGNALGKQTSMLLLEVHEFCVLNELPPLTSLVVRKSGADEGLPGRGFWQLYELEDAARETKEEVLKIMHLAVFSYFKDKEFLFTTPDCRTVITEVRGTIGISGAIGGGAGGPTLRHHGR